LKVFTILIFDTFFWLSALVISKNTRKSIKLHMIIKINVLAATSEQFLVILNNSLGMPVCQNKVLVVEI